MTAGSSSDPSGPATNGLVAIGGASSAVAQPAVQLVSQNNIALNCTTMQAWSSATVSVKFWTGTVPSDSASFTANNTLNCGVDATRPCTGPLLSVNFNIAMMTPFMASFSSGALLFAYPVRGSSGYTAVKNLVGSAAAVQPSTTMDDINNNPPLIAALCGACGASFV